MPSGEDGQLGAGSPIIILLIGLVLLFAAVAITKKAELISRWFCEDSRRLQAVRVLALVFGLFGFVMVGRAGMIESWSFDRVALALGGFTIIAAGRAVASMLARKRREVRRREAEEQNAAKASERPPAE